MYNKFNLSSFIIALCIVIAFGFQALLVIHIFNQDSMQDKAMVSMSTALLVLWVGVCGFIILKTREKIRKRFTSPNFFVLKFFIFAILMCMIEELITTSLTNTAYLWGLSPYEVYITGSPNYIEVLTKHSLIAFLPQFLCWGIIVSKYDISAQNVLIIYGITGYLNELIAFGIGPNVMSLPFWILVYGLILYLPAYALKRKHGLKEPNIAHYILFIVVPIIVSIPWILFLHHFIL